MARRIAKCWLGYVETCNIQATLFNQLPEARNQAPNGSEVVQLTDPTHQHPQFTPPEIIEQAAAAEQEMISFAASVTSGLVRRDATKCLPDGTCADGSCCNVHGTCGYGPDNCGAGNCTGSTCGATAMCGKYSKDGKVKCGMNLCCSATGWCGTSELYCVNGDPAHNTLPCQDGFGSCEVKSGRTCGLGSGSSKGRTIGYYQGSNTRDRWCNNIFPSDIVSDGYTHLYYAFASIDPSSYSIVPATAADIPIYTEFTALKSRGLQTWIAVGGFDFSDPSPNPTHETWSNVCSSSANRAAFIKSLVDFMSKYGFQGVDLDWEYPVAPERGGHEDDTKNFVLLVQEMRAAFGTNYGISLTLAPDYWYLRYFDAKAMESSVDFFGFMAYDLHGPWDINQKTITPVVRGQSDIREIANDTLPLWFDALDPSKINFGVALYGRGFTLSDPSCNTLGCPFSGASKAGPCTHQDGAMGLSEINDLIKKKNLTPRFLPDALMMEVTWDDQWIGYDDESTIARKKSWADDQCFGGTMAWSVDFNSGAGNGLTPNVTTDGKCGVSNGHTVCGDWSAGNCCSALVEFDASRGLDQWFC